MTSKAMTLHLRDVANHTPAYVETLFSLANGRFGVRASDPLAPSATAGTLVNGFYETAPITYGEAAYGYAKAHQTIVLLLDLRRIALQDTAGEWFKTDHLVDVQLDLATGESTYVVVATTPDGKELQVTLRQVVAQDSGVTALTYELLPLNFSDTLCIEKKISPLASAEAVENDPRHPTRTADLTWRDQVLPGATGVTVTTANSHLAVTLVLANGPASVAVVADQPTDLTYFASVSAALPVSTAGEAAKRATYPTIAAPVGPYEAVAAKAATYWQEFWANAEVVISGDDDLNLALHYNLFQLQAAAGRDGTTNIAAKGLSGTGYEGHYFWDTEVYMLPFFTATDPAVAKQLLRYRAKILPQAKQRARTLGVAHGALFAWRTIDGAEASAYFPAGTAQYHIDGDVAYAVVRYFQATGDRDFLRQGGYELVLETARFWANFGAWHDGRFEYFTVTGPDEYTALVNNNYYTNKVAQANLGQAATLAAVVGPDVLTDLGVTDAELADFRAKAEATFLPYSEKYLINAQDDSFFSKPVWPFADTPKDHYPLLLHYHPLTIYRYQVAKQADTLLADFMFPTSISATQLQREYDYYEKITTHDSSLSRAIFSILAAWQGDTVKAYNYFTDTVRMDLTDLQGNADAGLHLANLGGSWLSVVAGFAGMQRREGLLHFTNHLPKQWQSLSFRLREQGTLLQVTLTPGETLVTNLGGDTVTVVVDGQEQQVGVD